MKMTSSVRWGVLALLCAAPLTQGCFPPSAPPPVYATASAPTVVATANYNPMYYDGYVVYYDDGGRPLYYVNGSPVYVPPTYRGYHSLVNHYHHHRVPYRRWYANHGVRYRHYRHPSRRHSVRVRGPRRSVHVRRAAPAPRPSVRVRRRGPAPRRPGRVHHRGPSHRVAPAPPARPRRTRRRAPPPQRRTAPAPRSRRAAPAPPPSPPSPPR